MQRIPEPEYMDIEEEADAYANANFNEVNEAFVDRLLEFAGPCEAANLLDLGSGPGDIPLRISVLRPTWRVIGLDASKAMLKRALRLKKNAGKTTSPTYVLGDAKQLPFPTHYFDLILSNSILHHIADISAFWREIRRVAKPGSLLFLRDLSRPHNTSEAERIVAEYAGDESPVLQEEFYRSLLAAYTPEEVRLQLISANLRTMQVQQITDRHLDIWGAIP